MTADGLLTGRPLAAWQYQAPAATPASAQPAPGAQSLLERAAGGQVLGEGDLGQLEAELNQAIAALGAQRRPRPAAADPGDLGELAGRMHAASGTLAATSRRGSYAGGELPDLATQQAWEAQLGALVDQDPAARRPAPEAGSLPARLADVRRRLDDPAGLDGAARHQLGLDLAAAEQELNGEVLAAQAAADRFDSYGRGAVQAGEELLERALANPRALTPGEAETFEAALNQRVAELGRNPELSRPNLAEPAPAKPASQPTADPLEGVDPRVVLAALAKLQLSQEQEQELAGLVAGDEGGT